MIRDIETEQADGGLPQQTAEAIRETFLHAPVGIAQVDAHGRFLLANAKFCELTGYSLRELASMPVTRLVYSDDLPRCLAYRQRLAAAQLDHARWEVRLVRGDQSVAWVELTVALVHDAAGEPAYTINVMQDITERKRAERALRDAEARARRFAQIVDQSGDAIITKDLNNVVLSWNRGAERMFDCEAACAIGRHVWEITNYGSSPSKQETALARIRSAVTVTEERTRRTAEGREFVIETTFSPLYDDDGAHVGEIAILRDVTDRKRMQAQLLQLEHYDSLTQLPNRTLFLDRLSQALVQAKRKGWHCAVMVLDLDRFKSINDSMGHSFGDLVIRAAAERVRECLRSSDTVGRFGGDEFGLILRELTGGEDAARVARKICAAFTKPLCVEGQDVFVTASIGITVHPHDGEDIERLIRNADAAMYRAKSLGRNGYQFHSEQHNNRAQRKLQIEQLLHRALERGEFAMHYQPKLDIRSGEITGVEALLRWNPEGHPAASPAEFVPVLEETGHIVEVGEWALNTACREVKQWTESGLKPISVAVNLSPRQLRHGSLVDAVAEAIEESGIEPGLLELEVTESSLLDDGEEVIGVLARLRAMGVRLSIDDFGTGYSSLAYIKRLPLDTIKIDQSFVRNIDSSPDDAAIVRAVISLAHSLKLTVVAEGVETEAQMRFMTVNGCDYIQGYFVAKPMPATECLAALQQMHGGPRIVAAAAADRTLLLVDDEENILSALRRLFRRDGYRVFTANCAREALELLGRHPVGVILSDQRMPEMTGTEFLSKVKDLYPDTVRMVLSGYTELQSVTDAVNRGAIYKFLTKPWDDEQLRSAIEEAFRRRELMRENERLGRELRSANSKLWAVNTELSRLVEEKSAEIQHRQRSLGIAQELLHQIPLPVVGIDDDGMVALANAKAEAMFAGAYPLLGAMADEMLPGALRLCLAQPVAADAASLVVGGERFTVLSRPMGRASDARGRLLVLLPEGLAA